MLPLVGNLLNGYMPNREIITFDFAKEKQQMSLIVETLPFLPTIDIYGDDLQWDEATSTIEYTVRRKHNNSSTESNKKSTWKILYADQDIVAAKSSVTGLNVIRRI
mmetsp:Transcript_22366/g.26944  ORF Transcript_22366/g.26944 Transcript_22366/m.26944 type:complete len:106 (+) Transcript_22366:1-318(+)